MSFDDDTGAADDGDAVGFTPPLPPEDRLWRHPSELGAPTFGDSVRATAVVAEDVPPPRLALWGVALVAGLAGAALAAGVLTAAGVTGDRTAEPPVVEKVALTQVGTSPLIGSAGGTAALTDKVARSVARVEVQRGAGSAVGSAVLVRSDGHLVTSAQLVGGASSVRVVLPDGRRVRARLVGADVLTDVAVLHAEPDALDGLTVAVTGGVDDLEVGHTVLAVGTRPDDGRSPAVTRGLVSAVARQTTSAGGTTLYGLIETDAPLAGSVAGAALADLRGAVVGITTPVEASAGEAYGYAVPFDDVRDAAVDLIEIGRVRHCWLGVWASTLDGAAAASLGVDAGAQLSRVEPASPAGLAGLAAGDVITAVDGAPVDTMSALVLALRRHQPGDHVVLDVWRGDGDLDVGVTLSERAAGAA